MNLILILVNNINNNNRSPNIKWSISNMIQINNNNNNNNNTIQINNKNNNENNENRNKKINNNGKKKKNNEKNINTKKNKNTRKVLLKDQKKFFYHDINKLKYLKNLDIDQKIYENLIPQWKKLTNEKQWVIGTLNCHGLTKVGEIDALAQDLCEMKSDIFVITET